MRREAGIRYGLASCRQCMPAKRFGRLRAGREMGRHPPSTCLGAARQYKPFSKTERGHHGLAARDSAPKFRAIGAHHQLPVDVALDPYVGGSFRQYALYLAIDREAELGRKADWTICKRALQFLRNGDDLIICRPEGGDENIASRFNVRIRIKQAKLGKPVDQRRMAFVVDASDLKVGPAGEIDQPVAVAI